MVGRGFRNSDLRAVKSMGQPRRRLSSIEERHARWDVHPAGRQIANHGQCRNPLPQAELLRGEDIMREEAEKPTGADPGNRARSNTGTAGRRKVLVVDDSSTVLLMERALLSRDYEVIIAMDGREGVEKALAEMPDLILMDVVMPRMSGLEAVRLLRADPVTRHIPVIMVSTRGEWKSVEGGYESGCNDYVTKPFNGVELVAKVRNCIGG